MKLRQQKLDIGERIEIVQIMLVLGLRKRRWCRYAINIIAYKLEAIEKTCFYGICKNHTRRKDWILLWLTKNKNKKYTSYHQYCFSDRAPFVAKKERKRKKTVKNIGVFSRK